MNKHFKRNLAAGAACAVGLGLMVAPTTALAAGAGGDLPTEALPATGTAVNLLHFNDFHGRIAGAETDDEGVYTPGSTLMFAATIEQLRADYPDNSLLFAGGDSIGASNFTSASQGDEPTIDVLNAIGLDASAVGNHEFDKGVDDIVAGGRVDLLADFPYLSANVTLEGAPIGPAYATFTVDNGTADTADDVTVGVIGAVTEQTPTLVAGGGIVGVEFSDPVAAINAVAVELSDGNAANGEADVIVAEIHEGAQVDLPVNAPQAEQDAALAPMAAEDGAFGDIVNGLSAEVDVIFNGHTHSTYSWLAPVPGTDGEKRPIVQSNEYSNLVGQVTLDVDPATGDVVDVLLVQNNERLSMTETEVADAVADNPVLATVQDIVTDAETQAAIVGNEQVGTITGPITVPAESNGNRAEESTAAQMVANMYRDQLAPESRGDAEVGIVNPGGVRDSLLYEASGDEAEDGIVTLAEANTMLPFINNLWSITLTGAEFDQLLEEQWQRAEDGTPLTSGRTYLQLGISDNVTYVSDPTAPWDDRVSDIQIDGEYITPDQEIRIASASFLIGVNGGSPGDNFWTFAEGADARDSGLVDLDAMLAYLDDNPGLAPDYTVRHVDVTGLPSEPVLEGAQVTIEVGQIDRIRSTGAEASETLEVVNSAGEVVGSGDVVVNDDDSGDPLTTSAEVTFAVDLPAAATAEPAAAEFTLRSSIGSEIPFQFDVYSGTERIAGENRYETAVEISQSGYAGGADVVYVASGQLWPDALTAGPAAAAEGGPLLLVREGMAPQVVLDEIERLGAERVVIVGGTPSVNADVQAAIAEIESVVTIDRLGGENRYETSRMVADYAFDSAEGAYVVTGKRFPDALSASAAAGHRSWPLVLVNTATEVPATTTALLDELAVNRVIIVGSADAVPTATAGDFVDARFTVDRLGGVDRYATSAMITLDAFDSAQNGAYLANGLLFPDALAGGANAAAEGSPLLISREGCVPQSVLDALDTLAPTSITLLGGEPSLDADVAGLVSCG